MKLILIVEDDLEIGNVLQEILIAEGYRIARAFSGTEALLFLSNHSPDLVLLDLMLPGLCGEEVLRAIQDIPVIVLSAKVDLDHKVDLLSGGAVDYITKPFYPRELLARIAIHLRTFRSSLNQGILVFDELELNMDTRLLNVQGKEIKLTRTEFAILKLLMINPNQVITKSQLLDRISDDTPDCTEGSLKMHISNLRKKLREVSKKDSIEAIWGIGFKMKSQ